MVRDLRKYIEDLRDSMDDKDKIILIMEERLKKYESHDDDKNGLEEKQKVLKKYIEQKHEKLSKLKDKFPYKPSRLKKPLKIAIHGEKVIPFPVNN